MISKLTSLSAMALIGSLGVAAAQSPPSKAHTPPTAAQLNADTHNGTILNGGHGPKFDLGWNYFHIQFCFSFYSGSTFYLYFYPIEGGSWFTTDPNFQALFYPACGTGNFSGVYVTATDGTWNYAEVFDYK
jgi:hypothetical protein